MGEEPSLEVVFREQCDLEEISNEVLYKKVDIQAREKIHGQTIDELYQVTLYDHLALRLKTLTDEYTRGIQERTLQHVLGDEDHMRYIIGETTITLSHAKNAQGETRDYNLARTEILLDIIDKALDILEITPEKRIEETRSTTTDDTTSKKTTRITFDKKRKE